MTVTEFLLKVNPVKSVRVPIKLGLSAALSLMMALYLVIQVISLLSDDITFREKEIHGTRFIPTLYKTIGHTQVTRGLTNAKLNGAEGVDARIIENRNGAMAGYDELERLLDEYGEIANLRTKVTAARQLFESINSRAFSGPAGPIFQEYTSLITELRGYIVDVGDDSNLTLDPELDTFYLMDYLIFKAHVTAEASGVLRGRGSGIIASNNYSAQALIPFARILGGANADGLLLALNNAASENDRIRTEIQPLINDLSAAIELFGGQVLQMVEQNSASVSSAEYFQMGTDTIGVIYGGVGTVNALLQTILQERVDKLIASRNLEILITAVIFFVTVIVFTATIISIVDSLKKTSNILASVADGKLDRRLVVETRDEFADLAESLNGTQQTLRQNIERDRKQSEETLRIKSALDVADTPVMLADTELNIIYTNKSAEDMMMHRGETLRTALPTLDYRNLVGTNVDQFHKNPSHQRNLLADLRETYRSQINVAGLTFDLTATPLFNENNVRLGTVIEWEDRTEELAQANELKRVAEENSRIKQALDGVTTNTMIADADRKIVYINKSVHSMLKKREGALRKTLPNFNADGLIGQSIDVFHKNPSHQSNLLASMKDTHRAQITVADLHFGLTANPVYDDDGNRIGSVVEWDDRTEEVNIQSEIDKLINSASHGDLSQRIELEDKDGFFKSLSEGLNQLVGIAEGVVTDTARVFSAMSHGDLTETIEKHYEGAFGDLKNDANLTVSKLTEIITQIREAASTVSSGAEEIAQGNADLSQRTEEQASSLEETASSMEEMTSAVKSSADNAVQANTIAQETETLASSGGSVVQDAVNAMSEINESSKHIADIIGVIDEIAFQTNLLALNAAVEAARAGEQGRGFAVVASEVRSLAQRSAAAAKEIKDLIRDSVDKVSTGSELVNRSGETLQDIVESVQKVSEMVGDISGSASEQSSGIEQVNKAVSQMDEMTQQNAALVEEATAAGEAMADQARKLLQQMAFFTLGNDSGAMTLGQSRPVSAPAPTTASKSTAQQPTQPPAPVRNTPPPSDEPSVVSQGGSEVVDDDDDWEEF